MSSKSVSYPEMKETQAPKDSVSFDESSTIRGSASLYSLVGHDDPTAVMGNTTEKSARRYNATIASFLSRDDDDEYREPFESLEDRSAHLREQLEELDQAANGWSESRRSESGSERDAPATDIETFYVHEAGAGDTMSSRPPRTKTGLPEIVEEEQDTSDGSEQGDEEIESEARDQLMPISARLGFHRQLSADGSRASGYISSDNSLTSTERQSSIRSTISIDDKHEGSISLRPGETDGSSNHTIEVVRGVQEVLRSLDASPVGLETPTIFRDDRSVGSSTGKESTDVMSRDALVLALRNPKGEIHSKYQFKAYVPIMDERNASIDEEATEDDIAFALSETSTSSFRKKVQRVVLPACCLAIIAAVIIALVFGVGVVGKSSGATQPSGGSTNSTDGTTLSPTISPITEPTTRPVPPPIPPARSPTSDPTMIPVAAPTLAPVPPPTSSPSIAPPSTPAPQWSPPSFSPIVTNPPISTASPTRAPVEAPTTDGMPSTTMPNWDRIPTDGAPSTGEDIFVDAKTHLKGISGDLLDDPTTPQYEAYQWLMNDDPESLDLDTIPETTLEQRYIAAVLYFSTNGDSWVDSLGFLGSGDVCTWRDALGMSGISCDAQGTIVRITISQNGLQGRIPFELQALTYLKTLELGENLITGTVPPELGNLVNLEVLDLRQNELFGTFPSSIFALPNLKKLFMLRNANLAGTLPDSIEKATNLEMISFQRCKLSGSIPSAIGTLSNLYFLTLLDNNMTGNIPPGLTQLPKLEVLELASNMFTGSVPAFAAQPLLYFVSLFENRFSSRIPHSLGNLPGLLFFDVRDNEFTGPIPSTFGNIPELVTFYASGNKLTGPLPNFAGNVGQLQSIDVANNQLTGNLGALLTPDGPVGEWHTINAASNFLTGSIPAWIGQYTRLANVLLADNQLSGTIPTEIAQLMWLNNLDLGTNKIVGTIPVEIGLNVRLQYLDLSGNQMNGTITSALGMLPDLSVLDLSTNKFVGTLPASFAALRGVNELFLQENDLSGDFDPVLCPVGAIAESVGNFAADCRGTNTNAEVTCSCCTTCCHDSFGCLSQ